MAQAAPPQDSLADEGPQLLGHPRGLFVLFFAEMWERFCFYGMRALLAVYVAKQFFPEETLERGKELASGTYGGYTAMVYALGIFGGSVADRVLGYRRSILVGGVFMVIGEFMLMSPLKPMFYLGLAALVVGVGLFKPNVSTLVGSLYRPGDPRRDGGFTIFYMGINIGAFLAPIACEAFSQYMGSDRYGFALAGAGMLLGLVTFGIGTPWLRGKGGVPPGREGWMPIALVVLGGLVAIPLVYAVFTISSTAVAYALYSIFIAMELFLIWIAMRQPREVKHRMFVLVLLLLLNVAFWSGFEQAGNSLNFFAKESLIPFTAGDWSMPFVWWQSVNAAFIVLLGPLFAALWVWLDRRRMNPSIPAKFGIGLLLMGSGFWILNQGIGSATADGKVFWYFLLGLYFVHTCGELCLSPVGLSMVTKLAPEKITSMVMGAWFLAIAAGNYIASEFSSLAARKAGAVETQLAKAQAYGEVFHYVFLVGAALGLALLLSSRLVNRGMHGVK
jgi:POT family proton-dependent oligopeptide transporter